LKDDKVYLRHILGAIEKIRRYTAGIDEKGFISNDLVQDAVMRELEIIGEATKLLSEETKSKMDPPWKDIAGMRDKLIHNYFGVDLEAVWLTVTENLDGLEKEIRRFLG
jgi:uncharacterized protein with HEPN domain